MREVVYGMKGVVYGMRLVVCIVLKKLDRFWVKTKSVV